MTIDHDRRPRPGADPARQQPPVADRADWAAEPAIEPSGAPDPAAGALQVLTGRMVGLRFLLASLRRTRRIWLTAAAVGLVAGVGYHLVVPVNYAATATLYLAHPANSASTVASANDLALLQTPAIAERAIARLGADGRGLTPASLLGKAPATAESGNVLLLDIAGPTSTAAVRRVDALASAYLSFRAGLYEQQNRSFVAAADRQMSKLQVEIATLTTQIVKLTTPNVGAKTSPQLTTLQSQRAAATSALASLQQSVQQGNIDTLSVVEGSKVITPGTPVPTSRKKALAFDGLTGMLGLLGATVLVIGILSVLSDRLQRREDVATLAGAPVAVSVPHPRRHLLRRPSITALAAGHDPALPPLVHHMASLAAHAPQRTLLVVAADDARVPAAALLAAGSTLAAKGQRVVLVDETSDRSVGKALGARGPGRARTAVGSAPEVTVVVPRWPWELDEGAATSGAAGGSGAADGTDRRAAPDAAGGTDAGADDGDTALDAADRVLVIATVDPSVGAWHLRRWGTRAALSVTAGRATARRLAALTELLAAAGITLPSAVLLGADPDDESVGLPVPASPLLERRLSMLRPSAPPSPAPAPALST